jgi:SAM-dependent methyltransferase
VPYVDFISAPHRRATRDYLERVLGNKAECARISKRFGQEYWDGDRKYGYGGYRYDGRWRPVARAMAAHYGLEPGARILDVGCGKGYLLYDFTDVVPGARVAGLDVSRYAIAEARPELKGRLQLGSATHLPYADQSVDLVIAVNTLHNLPVYDLDRALREIERVSRAHKYVVMDSYRTEEEKVNLLNWQLTCECFFTPAEWEWLFARAGYTGDYAFVFFE